MSFNRPDLPTILNRIQGDIQSRFVGSDPTLRHTLLGILAQVKAGGIHGLYGYIDWLSRQILPSTADADMLDVHGSIWGVQRKMASFAQGSVVLDGINGSVIPAGTLLQNTLGLQFSTNAEVIIILGTATIQVTAMKAGTSSNVLAGASLALVSPVNGVNSTATVGPEGITNGTDIESDADYRKRIISHIQEAPHGGSSLDYEAWALEVPGVTRVWVYPQELGVGTVTIRCVTDGAASIIPDAAKIAEVQTHIDTVRPVTAVVTVVPPIAKPLDFQIQLTPNTTVVQDAVKAEISDLLRREATPGGTILISHIQEAISLAAGETNHVLVVPNTDVGHNTGEIAVMGMITWL